MFRHVLVLVTLLFVAAAPPGHAAELSPESSAMRVPPLTGPARKVVIFVIDNRPFVLDGDKQESFEGLSRELYGIPIPRATNDRSTMATYLGERLRIGFQRANYEATYLPSPKGSLLGDRLRAQEAGNPDLFFVVDLKDWHYDFGGFKPSFDYDVSIQMYDDKRRLLAGQTLAGNELMPTGGWKHFKVRYAELYQTIFDRIFALPAITAALRGDGVSGTVVSATIEERLARLRKLLADGLIDQATFEREQQRVLGEI